MNVYAKHYANASSSQYGLLNMILTFATIGTKLLFCSLADRYRAYRSFFIFFLITALIGYGSFAVLPYFVTPPAPETAGVNGVTFGLICLMTSVATISMSVISCLADAFAVNSAKKYGSSYGMIRLWGTIGWGVSAFLLAFINRIDQLLYLVPGLIMTIILLMADIMTTIFWTRHDDFELDKSASDMNIDGHLIGQTPQPIAMNEGQVQSVNRVHQVSNYDMAASVSRKVHTNGQREYVDISSVKMQWILFKEVACRRRSIFRYMALFTISGALISLQWSYFFQYLEQIYTTEFTFISGISMLGQSMLGELPFFLLSQRVIERIGRSHTLTVSIVSIGMRYLLYKFLLPNASMYFVLVTEIFQGPNFGLFYVVMTEVGLDYSDCEDAIVSTVQRGIVENHPEQIGKLRQVLRATMQSLMSACYEGLGAGIGSIIGGLVIDFYDFDSLWFYSALIAIFLGLTNWLIDISGLPVLVDKDNSIVLANG